MRLLRLILGAMIAFVALTSPTLAQNAFAGPSDPMRNVQVTAQPNTNPVRDQMTPLKATLHTTCGLSDFNEGLVVRAPQDWEFKPNAQFKVISANEGSIAKGIAQSSREIVVTVFCKRPGERGAIGIIVVMVDYVLRPTAKALTEWRRQSEIYRIMDAEKRKRIDSDIKFQRELIRIGLVRISQTQGRIDSIRRSLDGRVENFKYQKARNPESIAHENIAPCIADQEIVAGQLDILSVAMTGLARNFRGDFYATTASLIGELVFRNYCTWSTYHKITMLLTNIDENLMYIERSRHKIWLLENGYK